MRIGEGGLKSTPAGPAGGDENALIPCHAALRLRMLAPSYVEMTCWVNQLKELSDKQNTEVLELLQALFNHKGVKHTLYEPDDRGARVVLSICEGWTATIVCDEDKEWTISVKAESPSPEKEFSEVIIDLSLMEPSEGEMKLERPGTTPVKVVPKLAPSEGDTMAPPEDSPPPKRLKTSS